MKDAVTLREVHLHGILGEKYGKMHRFAVHSPNEAFRALFANFPAMKHDIKNGSWEVLRGDVPLDETTLGLGLGKASLHIVPEGAGSGGRSGKLIIGAVIIIACLATGQLEGVGLEAGILGGALTLGQVAGIGVALAISGIAQLIAPNQKDNKSASAGSNLFTGAQNTAAEGTAMPIVYGEILMGSVVGSVFLATEQQSTAYIPPSPAPVSFPGVQVVIQT